ncbi:MAG TPA: zinc ribbon domain-containing protein [Pyrinomonadaceae bacterium]|nr:zinc ribbon domain-containing protein [Pyrinomonadaceae bacterium]
MFCPACGQRQLSEDTRFCSKCGFLLTGVTELIINGGALPQAVQQQRQSKPTKDSPRKRGIKQGLFIFLLSFLVVPLIAIFTIAIEAREPFMVAVAAILLTVGGLLRMAYALMFESTEPYGGGAMTPEENALNAAQNFLGKNKSAAALPPQQSIPTSAYVPPAAGNWRDTNDLSATPGVTENTTKFLDGKR